MLTRDELLLLDRVLQLSTVSPEMTFEECARWGNVRRQVWDGLHQVDNIWRRHQATKSEEEIDLNAIEQPVVLAKAEAETLLAMVPPVFRWGAGAECGYTFKLKLYRYLSGKEVYQLEVADDKDTTKDSPEAVD